jgi:hypothetical protein
VVNIRLNLEQTADTVTRQTVAHFRWTFGAIHVQHRVISAGLLPAVVEAWYPHDNDSYGVLLEDDVEVSPQFYAWIKVAILRYRSALFAQMIPRLNLFSRNLSFPQSGMEGFSNAHVLCSA